MTGEETSAHHDELWQASISPELPSRFNRVAPLSVAQKTSIWSMSRGQSSTDEYDTGSLPLTYEMMQPILHSLDSGPQMLLQLPTYSNCIAQSTPSTEPRIAKASIGHCAQLSIPTRSVFDFPLELEREIFETAAINWWDRQVIAELLLVARRVREWVDLEEVIGILKYCTNAKTMALLTIGGTNLPLITMLATLPLQRLSVDMVALFNTSTDVAGSTMNIVAQKPLFANLTHLDVTEVTLFEWSDWKWLASIPRLKYLSLAVPEESFGEYVMCVALVEKILAECLSLELLVLYNEDDLPFEHLEGTGRIIVVEREFDDFISEWQTDAQSDHDKTFRGWQKFLEENPPRQPDDGST
ncbi:hypothetical protein B0H34DRAFT_798273 [Crassisporium funariophilum]|nr:hypothetical protein B0H34DRAFT_798273 [Crassisporium funariophilum]